MERKTLPFLDPDQRTSFIETVPVIEGVKCHVYEVELDARKDIALIEIAPGKATPRQRVLGGLQTVEGWISGKGKLVVEREEGPIETFRVKDGDTHPQFIRVWKGDTMQWVAENDSPLVVYEVCYPPYKEGRFLNLTDR